MTGIVIIALTVAIIALALATDFNDDDWGYA